MSLAARRMVHRMTETEKEEMLGIVGRISAADTQTRGAQPQAAENKFTRDHGQVVATVDDIKAMPEEFFDFFEIEEV